MKSKQPSIRLLGQRSIPSTFFSRSTNRFSDSKKNVIIKASKEKGSKISLSEYLNRKLQRGSVLPGSVQGKERPLLSPLGREHMSSCAEGEIVCKERREATKDLDLEIVLQQFKDTKREKENFSASASDELGCGSTDYKQESRKRIRVLGDESRPKKRREAKSLASKEESIPLFNHYANGGGWWDYDMEGVDNEEVGCSDVWEGMGSTTLGGLDWH